MPSPTAEQARRQRVKVDAQLLLRLVMRLDGLVTSAADARKLLDALDEDTGEDRAARPRPGESHYWRTGAILGPSNFDGAGMQDCNVLKFDLPEHSARQLLQEICDDAHRLIFTDHALKRMRERKVTRTQVIDCLRRGRFIEGPARDIKGNWKMTLEKVCAGTLVKVVTALDYRGELGNYAAVITVI